MIDHFPRNPETGRAMLPEAEWEQPQDEASPVMTPFTPSNIRAWSKQVSVGVMLGLAWFAFVEWVVV